MAPWFTKSPDVRHESKSVPRIRASLWWSSLSLTCWSFWPSGRVPPRRDGQFLDRPPVSRAPSVSRRTLRGIACASSSQMDEGSGYGSKNGVPSQNRCMALQNRPNPWILGFQVPILGPRPERDPNAGTSGYLRATLVAEGRGILKNGGWLGPNQQTPTIPILQNN